MKLTAPARIDYLSRLFLDKPYLVNPQGEGDGAEFDSAPLFRFDGFDCVTYVGNILALSISQGISDFEKKIIQMNYYDANVNYKNRFHFMSLDWNKQNEKNKIIKDITAEILDQNKNAIALIADGEIDKPSWFLKKAENESPLRAAMLQKYALQSKRENAKIAYLPLSNLFETNKTPIDFIFNQIPHASIIEIVRPNWNLKEKIGTNLHVSHLGFAIRENNELLFRHASSEAKKVVQIPLSDYLVNYLDSPTIKGIYVAKVIP